MAWLIFIYLAIFPFGQLLKYKSIGLADLIVLISALIFIFLKRKKGNQIILIFSSFLFTCLFSLFASLWFFSLNKVFNGGLYLLRLVSYVIFAQWLYQQNRQKELVLNSLVAIGVFVGIFGFFQYIFLPDLTTLKILGWDDHYFRLVSTFLDPAFTGIILVLAEIAALVKYSQKKSNFLFALNLFLIISLLLTYSRASFLSLIGGILFLLWKLKEKSVLIFLFIFLLMIPFLPKPGGEGVNLLRTASANQKLQNFEQSLTLIRNSPLAGFGFNNICEAKQKFFKNENPASHACSGLDNSFLFIMATTGLIGFLLFLKVIWDLIKTTSSNKFGLVFLSSGVAVLIHSFFTNTLFYSFVMGWFCFLISLSRKKSG